MSRLDDRIAELLSKNRRTYDGHTFTLPSPDLYPFQWLWDSCFHAIMLSYFDLPAAKSELLAACARPLPNGLLPHIIYWGKDTAVSNWGREMRGDIIDAAWGTEGTSAITQPPIIALAAWRVYERDGDGDFLRLLYPTLVAYYNLILTDRRLSPHGLAVIVNPDESGEDNSPRFDGAQNLPPLHSADVSLDRRIDRMRENAQCNFMVRDCMAQFFAVADVPFNVILAESLEYLARIAHVVGDEPSSDGFAAAAASITAAVREHLCRDGICHALDHTTGATITTETWALFMPLYGGILTAREAEVLVNETLLDPARFWTEFPVPSTALPEASFDPDEGFWRGPVWMAPNWFIYKGLRRYGFTDVAATLKEKTTALIERSGFREHYHPQTGKGLGAHDFTWGGLVIDMN